MVLAAVSEERSPSKSGQLPLTPQAKEAVKLVTDDLLRDIRRLAIIHAKNDGANVIDNKHIQLARAQLTNKHRTWVAWASKLSLAIGGAFAGFLVTLVLDPGNQVVTVPGTVALTLVTTLLLFFGLIRG